MVISTRGRNEKMTLQMGSLIRQLRVQKRMTQQALGSGIVSKSALSRIENGSIEPNLFTLNALLHRLGKSLKPFEIIVSNQDFEQLKCGEYESSLQTIVLAEGEYFKDIRKAKGLSQEQFSSDICARETISNIENGRAPQRKKIKVLLEKQGEPFEKYFSYVIAQEYEIYELAEEYQYKINSNLEEAKQIRQRIENKIDGELPINRQFLESASLMEMYRDGLLTSGEELAGLERCLRYTMPECDGEIYRIPYRQEVIILEEIIKCLQCLQRIGAAKSLAKVLVKKNGKKMKIPQNVTAL